MEIDKHYDGIYEIKDFLTDEEVNQLFSFIDLNSDSGWNYKHPGNVLSIVEDDKDKNNLKIVFEKIEKKVTSYFTNFTHCNGFQNIRRLKKDENLPVHVDADENSDRDPIIFGVVIFLNDNFKGGELHYTEIGLAIKPIKKSCFIHRATYKHEVLKVIDGNRYCITTFIRGSKDTKIVS